MISMRRPSGAVSLSPAGKRPDDVFGSRAPADCQPAPVICRPADNKGCVRCACVFSWRFSPWSPWWRPPNFLVQFPVQGQIGGIDLASILTWGAFTYPVAFLVTDLTNRQFGPASARRVVLFGFAIAVFWSIFLATPAHRHCLRGGVPGGPVPRRDDL